jgi:hypothetical protein
MPQRCTVCHHPRIADISADMVGGATDTAIAQRYGLARASVGRHRVHIKAPTAASVAQRKSRAFTALAALPSAEEVGDAYSSIARRIDAIAARAESEGSLAVALVGLKELRTTIRAQAEIAGHVGGGATVQVAVKNEVNVDLGAAVRELAALITAGEQGGDVRGQPNGGASPIPLDRLERIADGE